MRKKRADAWKKQEAFRLELRARALVIIERQEARRKATV
jgi:hypothetical protein